VFKYWGPLRLLRAVRRGRAAHTGSPATIPVSIANRVTNVPCSSRALGWASHHFLACFAQPAPSLELIRSAASVARKKRSRLVGPRYDWPNRYADQGRHLRSRKGHRTWWPGSAEPLAWVYRYHTLSQSHAPDVLAERAV